MNKLLLGSIDNGILLVRQLEPVCTLLISIKLLKSLWRNWIPLPPASGYHGDIFVYTNWNSYKHVSYMGMLLIVYWFHLQFVYVKCIFTQGTQMSRYRLIHCKIWCPPSPLCKCVLQFKILQLLACNAE